MKQLSMDEIVEQIAGMEDATKKALIVDILETLGEFRENAPDTKGFDFAIQVIKSNY